MVWFYSGILVLIFLIFWLERGSIRQNLRDVTDLDFKRRSVWLFVISILFNLFLLYWDASDRKNQTFVEHVLFIIACELSMFVFALFGLGRASYQAFVRRERVFRGIAIFAVCISSMTCLSYLYPFQNPQVAVIRHMTRTMVLEDLSGTLFVGLGEESFKLLCIVSVFVLLRLLLKKRVSVAVLLSCLIASYIFGMIHIVAWNALTGVFIGSTSVIMVGMIVLYRNVWIPMLAHMTIDATAFYDLYFHRKVETYTVLTCLGVTVVYFLFLLGKGLRARRFRRITGSGHPGVL